MAKFAAARSGVLIVAILAIALSSAFFAARAALAEPSAKARVVATAKNAKLGKTVLVNHKGLTLYSLSVERRGRFICTNSMCLSFWTPLVVPKSTTPTGTPRLGTVKRPDDGRIQVTYKGRPLYTFYLDRKRGDTKGEGFKDVGIWHAASPAKSGKTAPPPDPYGGG